MILRLKLDYSHFPFWYILFCGLGWHDVRAVTSDRNSTRRLLLRAYQAPDGDVRYRAMHADCEEGSSACAGATDTVSVSASCASSPDDQLRQQQQQQQQQQARLAETKGTGMGAAAPPSPSPNRCVHEKSNAVRASRTTVSYLVDCSSYVTLPVGVARLSNESTCFPPLCPKKGKMDPAQFP